MLAGMRQKALVALGCLLLVTVIFAILTEAAEPYEAIERVSVDSEGNEGNENSFASSISADGRYVAFGSGATNLVPGDTNGHWDIFVAVNLLSEPSTTAATVTITDDD